MEPQESTQPLSGGTGKYILLGIVLIGLTIRRFRERYYHSDAIIWTENI